MTDQESWEDGFAHLRAYVAQHGHACPPRAHVTDDGFELGRWVKNRRRRDQAYPDRAVRLEALPGWAWSRLHDRAWEDGFAHLQAFVATYGHARPPRSHLSPDGFRLGPWVHNRRDRDRDNPARAARLEALPGWKWSIDGPRTPRPPE